VSPLCKRRNLIIIVARGQTFIYHQLRQPHRLQRCLSHGGQKGPRSPSRLGPARQTVPLQSRANPREGGPRERGRSVRILRGHPRHHSVHGGEGVFQIREEDAGGGEVLASGRGDGVGGHGEGRQRVCLEVLHRRRDLGFGGEQHSDLLHQRCDFVSKFYPHFEEESCDASQGLGHVLGHDVFETGDHASAADLLLG
jgi:hypothetical protein